MLVGNKVDLKNRKVEAKDITFKRKNCFKYYDISAKNNYQIEKPFVWLLRRLLNDDSVVLAESPLPVPTEVAIPNEKLIEL